MSKKAQAHSSVLNALRLTGLELMHDSDLHYERRRQLVAELENMYSELATRWADEFEYISPWKVQISADSLATGSQIVTRA